MHVQIDHYSGFCHGVIRAIKIAEKYLREEGRLYCLGEIVHNELEVKRLEKLGMQTIGYDEFKQLRNAKVLLRSHGDPPGTYELAEKNNIELIDATCGILINLQKKIKDAHKEGQVVIYGMSKHPEVISLKGQTGEAAIIIELDEDLEKIDYSRPVRLFSQTTMQTEKFLELEQAIADRMQGMEDNDFKSTNSICKQVSKRVPSLTEFTKQYDVVIFVSGKSSSNGKFLYSICKSVNENTYFVSGVSDLNGEWFKGVESVGVAGATSTPEWLLEEVAAEVRKY